MTNEEKDRETRIAAMIGQGLAFSLLRTLHEKQALTPTESGKVFSGVKESLPTLLPDADERQLAERLLDWMEESVKPPP